MADDLGPSGLLRWLNRQRDPSTPGRDEHPLRLESDARAVQIVTIHKSKGLQYGTVFCPYPWSASDAKGDDLLFHDPLHDYRLTLEIGASKDSPARECLAREQLSENLRLLYVALTRAKTRCYLAWGRVNTAETSSPAYLLHGSGVGTEGGPASIVAAMRERMAALTDADVRADLDQLAARSEGSIEIRPLPSDDAAGMRPPDEAAAEAPMYRTFTGTIDRSWRTGSYSLLVSGSHDPDAADHDPGFVDCEVRMAVPPDTTRIADFPAGGRAGSFFHAVLEEVDFRRVGHPDTERLIADRLRSFGFDAAWQGAVSRLVGETAEAELFPEGEFALSAVAPENRLAELEFHHPLKPLSPRALKEVFAPFEQTGSLQGFPERLGRLTFAPLQGHMKGFIDLVAFHGGRFYLIDWKSNRLGAGSADPGAYAPERLAAVMQDEFYVLQYCIYTLALHLYLRLRLPAYDYRRDFGGVAYVFLRGLDRKRNPRSGIYRDRPDPKLVHALGRALIPDYE
jgi:exodeoxyribonuclease V beta subunit